MEVVITSSDSPNIDWGASGGAEIAQNVFTLINTLQYEVAYDRTLGRNPDYLDMPEQGAVPLAIADIYRVIEEREPRATVEEVAYLGMDKDGEMTFRVVIDV